MVKIFILLIVGGLIGWIASLVMKTDKQMGPLANMGIGAAGAFLAGMLINPSIIAGDLTFISLAAALAGSIILLGIVNLIRKGRVR